VAYSTGGKFVGLCPHRVPTLASDPRSLQCGSSQIDHRGFGHKSSLRFSYPFLVATYVRDDRWSTAEHRFHQCQRHPLSAREHHKNLFLSPNCPNIALVSSKRYASLQLKQFYKRAQIAFVRTGSVDRKVPVSLLPLIRAQRFDENVLSLGPRI